MTNKTLKGDQILWDMQKRIEELERQVAKLLAERQTAIDRYSYSVQQARGEVR